MSKPALVVVFSTLVVVLSQLGLLASAATAPAPSLDCDSIILSNLAPCLDYVTPGTKTTTPPKECCDGLSTIVKNTPICLCQFLSNSSSTQGFPINATRAMGLPGACNIVTPPPSECNKHGAGPTPAPAPSPHQGKTSPSPAPSPKAPSPSAKAPSPSGKSSPPASSPQPSTETPTSPGAPTAQGPSGGVTSLESSVGILLAGLLLAVAAI